MYTRWRFHHPDVLLVFNFHQVTPVMDPRYHRHSTWTSLAHLQSLLEELKTRFTFVSLEEGIKRWHDDELERWMCAVTLDDGDISIEEYAAPLMENLGVPATFFINTAYLDEGGPNWIHLLQHLYHTDQYGLLPAEVTDKYSCPDDLVKVMRWTRDAELYRGLREAVLESADKASRERRLVVSREWLESLDPQQFHIGLHGHQHDRFAMMDPAWQREDLEKNREALRDYSAYRPVFAVPFGRYLDWDRHTIRVAMDLDLEIAMADGGINTTNDLFLKRIPLDHRELGPELRREVLGW